MNPGQFPGYHDHGGDHNMWAMFLLVLVVAFLIGLAVFLAVRWANRRAALPAAAGAAALEEPLAVLRMRYARGEVTREQFLQASADLGAGPAPPPS
jgi:uncharacterized membrane protein